MCCWCAWHYGPPPEPEPEPGLRARSAKRRRKQSWACSALRMVALMLFVQAAQALMPGGHGGPPGLQEVNQEGGVAGPRGGCLSARIAPLNRAYDTQCNHELAATEVMACQVQEAHLVTWHSGPGSGTRQDLEAPRHVGLSRNVAPSSVRALSPRCNSPLADDMAQLLHGRVEGGAAHSFEALPEGEQLNQACMMSASSMYMPQPPTQQPLTTHPMLQSHNATTKQLQRSMCPVRATRESPFFESGKCIQHFET